ncbi:hypothetical protein PR048_007516 [Dryococelus australis]|uniref:Uncharacterized protein n=1 Tax=Dryococelus australis TaxID=614101 RepID=A0ABQ9HUG0_9NEOP|nr:hypothetical protein PR048_007516 [Dryococelus australis]
MHTCIVTLDQPLFVKYSEIVLSAQQDSPVSCVIARLGGFHMLFSFLGSIGYVLKASGIEEFWETVCAKNSIPQMLTGHSLSRVVRAHILAAAALIQIINDPDDGGLNENLLILCSRVFNREVSCIEAAKTKICLNLMHPFRASVKIWSPRAEQVSRSGVQEQDKCQDLESKSRTGKLWLMYLNQVFLMLNFIRAEKTGNWKLHIATTIQMIPLFRATGYTLYGKSSQLYVQQIMNLQDCMLSDDFINFTTDSCFTIRCLDKEWSGVWTDIKVEQLLIRSIQSLGCLTRGRGLNENTVMRWILCVTIASETSTEVEDFAEGLDSISSGVVGDSMVSCDLAIEKGKECMGAVRGRTFPDIVIRRITRFIPLGTMSSIKVRGNVIPINALQLFNRIICLNSTPEDLKEYLRYELAPRPPSLFTESHTRKGTKSSLASAFQPEKENITFSKNCAYVDDGDYLLNCVVWPRPGTYGDVIEAYKFFVERHFGKNTVIVFDGNPDSPTTRILTFFLAPLTSLPTSENILFRRPQNANKGEIVFDISKQRELQHDVKDVLLLTHAMSGRDTTSAVFRKGKVKSLNLLKKDEGLRNKVIVFNENTSTRQDITTA